VANFSLRPRVRTVTVNKATLKKYKLTRERVTTKEKSVLCATTQEYILRDTSPDGAQSAVERARIVYQADQDAKRKRGLL